MDPFTLGLLFACGASGAVAAMGWRRRRGRGDGEVGVATPRALGPGGGAAEWARVGDVLTYTNFEYWLAGELSLMREGVAAVRLFTTPDRGRERWVALPRDGRSIWVLHTDAELAAIGWPGLEIPAKGQVLRRFEHGNVAVVPSGEIAGGWEGMGRFAMFRGMNGVALVVEAQGKDRLALVGEEIPRQLVQKMG